MGPTATGKTDAAAACFDAFASQIISVDSSLVYQGMDIGTAKPDSAFLTRYPHHLVDIRHPNETYSVADFVDDAQRLIKETHDANRIPVLAGGTMFYFSALEQGLSPLPSADQALREEITATAAAEGGWASLHAKLASLDPKSAQRIDQNDAQRIQRALEIVLLTGAPVPSNRVKSSASPYRFIKVGLSFSDRSVLHQRIEQRYLQMVEQGLYDEVQGLLESGVEPDTAAMRMIGYRQVLEFLQGDTSKDESIQKGIAATRQLAKRQLTWMRNQSNLIWWVNAGLIDKQFRPLTELIAQYLR